MLTTLNLVTISKAVYINCQVQRNDALKNRTYFSTLNYPMRLVNLSNWSLTLLDTFIAILLQKNVACTISHNFNVSVHRHMTELLQRRYETLKRSNKQIIFILIWSICCQYVVLWYRKKTVVLLDIDMNWSIYFSTYL